MKTAKSTSLFFILFLFLFEFSNADPIFFKKLSLVGHITGLIVDSAAKTPIPFATISLFPSGGKKPLDATVADGDGKFSLPEPVAGIYDLEVSFIGYRTKRIKNIVINNSSSDIVVVTIYLRTAFTKLKQVEVIAQRNLIEQKVDRLVYNAGNDATNRGGDATDVMRKVPLLSVDLDGNVSLRGSQNLKVLINGKTSTLTANGIADALKQIPADEIQSIEVLTSPPAKYDAEGSGGVINIVLKKNNSRGLFLNIDGSGGTKASNLGLNGNYRAGKMNFNLGGFGRASYDVLGNFMDTIVNIKPYPDGTFKSNFNKLIQRADTKTSFLFGRYNLGWDYDIDSLNSLNASIRYGARNNHINQFNLFSLNTVFKNPPTRPLDSISKTVQNSEVTNNSGQVDVSVNYTRIFKIPRKEFGFAGQYSRSDLTFSSNFNQLNSKSLSLTDSSTQNITKSINQEITLQIDYQFPINSGGIIEVGNKEILRTATSNSNYSALPPSSNNTGFNGSISPSSSFKYNQNVFGGYVSLNQTFAKHYTILAGARYEFTKIISSFSTSNQDIPSYYILVPSFNFIDRFKNGSSIRLGFNRRIQRPSIQFLNPNPQISNPAFQTVGNQFLKPEFTNNYEIGYSTFYKGLSLNISSFLRETTGGIQQTRSIDTTTSIITTTYNNIGSETAYGVNLSLGINLGSKVNLNGGADIFHDLLQNTSADPLLNSKNSGVVANFRFFGGYNFDKGWGLQFFTFYRGTVVQLQGTQGGFYVYSIALKKDFLNKKGSIGLGADNFFTNSVNVATLVNSPFLHQNTENTFHNRSLKITFSYRIGKQIAAKKKFTPVSINNDDQKDAGDQGGGTGAGQGGGGSGQGGEGSGQGNSKGGGSKPAGAGSQGFPGMKGTGTGYGDKGTRGKTVDSLNRTKKFGNPLDSSKHSGINPASFGKPNDTLNPSKNISPKNSEDSSLNSNSKLKLGTDSLLKAKKPIKSSKIQFKIFPGYAVLNPYFNLIDPLNSFSSFTRFKETFKNTM